MTPSEQSDEDVFARYQRGDEAAFEVVYDRFAKPIFRFLRRFIGDTSAAEDLTQQVFLRVHQARATFDPHRSLRTWIFTIARRLALNALDQRSRAPALGVPADIASESPSPEAVVARRDASAALNAALMTLPADERDVLLLSKYEDLSYAELGEIVGCSADAAKMRVHRALKNLGKALGSGEGYYGSASRR